MPTNPSLARRLGFGYTRTVDERPESFRNSFELAIPLWLIAMLLAIGPAPWLIARRAADAARTKQAAPMDAPAKDSMREPRSNVKVAVIALAVGIVIGRAASTWRRATPPPVRRDDGTRFHDRGRRIAAADPSDRRDVADPNGGYSRGLPVRQ